MTLHIEYETKTRLSVDYKSIIERCVNGVLDYENCPYEIELGVVLTDNASIQEVNMEQRGIDAPTDVLSFPMVSYETPSGFDALEEMEDCFHPETGELLLGDIMISVEKVISQAEEYGHSRERELGFLVVHSMLHLFGYDHIEEEGRIIMEDKQKEILMDLGINR